jgi:hypothetical protein
LVTPYHWFWHRTSAYVAGEGASDTLFGFEGWVALRWTAIGGILINIAGDVTTAIGVEMFRSPGGMLIGYFRGETFQYKPWNSVVAILKAEHS